MEFDNHWADFSPTDMEHFIEGILAGESNRVATLANLSALMGLYFSKINWAGFYLWDDVAGNFVLGPFQGKPACTRIAMGRGVVGAAAQNKTTLRIDDVATFVDHIACDSESRSELVVPIFSDDRVVAMIDVDSPYQGRFETADQTILEFLAHQLGEMWPSLT